MEPGHLDRRDAIRAALIGGAALLTVLCAARPANAQRESFTEHLIALHQLLGGPYGDEGPAVRGRIEAMAAALGAWDGAVDTANATLKERLAHPAPEVRIEALAALVSVQVNRGLFDAALRTLDAAILLAPERPAFHLLRGRLLDALGRERDALAAYERAWQLDPLNPVSAYLSAPPDTFSGSSGVEPPQVRALLDAHHRGVTLSAAAGAQPIPEVSLIADAASSRPVFAPALYADGFGLIAAGRYSEAVAQLRDAASRDPLLVDPVSRTEPMSGGIALLRDGRIQEALLPLRLAATQNPESSEAHRILGVVYAAIGSDEQAVALLRSAIRLAPRDERAHLALGRTLRDTGRLDEAEEALRNAASALPQSAEARWLLGDVLEKAGRRIEAAAEFEAAGSFPILAGKSALYWQAAEIYDRHQRFEPMVRLLVRRTRIDPNSSATHESLGLVQNRLGRPTASLVELLMADMLGGAGTATLTAIGLHHLAGGRLADAETTLRRAVAREPGHLRSRYALGRVLLTQGREREAREQLDAFQQLRDSAMEAQRRSFDVDKLQAEAVQHTSSGRHGLAAKVLAALVSRMPERADFRLGLADALTKDHQFAAAVPHLERAAALGAGPDVHRRLAQVYARLGRRDASERAQQTYEQRVRDFLRAPRGR